MWQSRWSICETELIIYNKEKNKNSNKNSNKQSSRQLKIKEKLLTATYWN